MKIQTVANPSEKVVNSSWIIHEQFMNIHELNSPTFVINKWQNPRHFCSPSSWIIHQVCEYFMNKLVNYSPIWWTNFMNLVNNSWTWWMYFMNLVNIVHELGEHFMNLMNIFHELREHFSWTSWIFFMNFVNKCSSSYYFSIHKICKILWYKITIVNG